MKVESDLQLLYDLKRAEVSRCLAPLDELDDRRMREIVRKYTAAVEPNFIPWVGAGVLSARSTQARFAASVKLEEELRGDHQGMLRDFAKSIDCAPTARHYLLLQPVVQRMRNQFRKMDGLTNMALLGYLENTSRAIIPYLADIAKRLGLRRKGSNFIYTDTHSEANTERPRQFLWALDHETKAGYDSPNQTIREATIEGGWFFNWVLDLRADPNA